MPQLIARKLIPRERGRKKDTMPRCSAKIYQPYHYGKQCLNPSTYMVGGHFFCTAHAGQTAIDAISLPAPRQWPTEYDRLKERVLDAAIKLRVEWLREGGDVEDDYEALEALVAAVNEYLPFRPTS
jgi:hypothetical protein